MKKLLLTFAVLCAQINLFGIESAISQNQGGRSYMEDCASFIQSPFTSNFAVAAVFDGHGGSKTSAYLKQEIEYLMNDRASNQKALQSAQSIQETFNTFNKSIRRNGYTDGSTAIVAIIDKDTVHIANVGDSRAVGSNGQALSIDHTPKNPAEVARVGAENIFYNRLGGVLAITRSFGDFSLEPYGLIATPEIATYKRADLDFIILASDGVWDCLSNEHAADFVTKRLAQGVTTQRIARELVIWSSMLSPYTVRVVDQGIKTVDQAVAWFDALSNTDIDNDALFPSLKTTHDNQTVVLVDLKK